MRYLTLTEVLELHHLVLEQSGGASGIRDVGALESSLAQPGMSFGGEELYPSLAEKAATLAFSLARNHPFADGYKRVAHAAMETFLVLNGHEIEAAVEEQELIMLHLAGGQLTREEFRDWLRERLILKRTEIP